MALKDNYAVVFFTFEADQPGGLGFKKGDIIIMTNKMDDCIISYVLRADATMGLARLVQE